MTDLMKENKILRRENDDLRRENSRLLELVGKLTRQMEDSIEYWHDNYVAIMMRQYKEDEQDGTWDKCSR